MRRFTAFILSLLLVLSLCSLSSADSAEYVFKARSVDMNLFSGTFAVRFDGSNYYQVMDAAGNILLGEEYKYTSIYPSSSYNAFKVEVDSADGVHDEGLIDGYGRVLVPAEYADVNIISDRWQAGIKLTPSSADDKDYTFTNYSTNEKNFYRIDTADIYFDGEKVGTLTRSEYGNGSCTAYNAYLAVTNMERERTYYNSKMEKSPVAGDVYGEYTQDYNRGKTTVIHNGSGQQAFVPSCTLNPDDLSDPYFMSDGIVYDLQGNVLFKTAHNYTTVRKYYNGYAVVYLDRKYGIIDMQGNEVVPLEYEEISSYENNLMNHGFSAVVKDGKTGFVDTQGNVTCPFTYSKDIVNVRGSFATVKNLDGTIIVLTAGAGELAEHFAEASFSGSSNGNTAFVGKNASDEYCAIDLYGNTLIPYTACRDIDISLDGKTALITYGHYEYAILTFDEAASPAGTDETPVADEAPVADDGSWTCENGHSGNTGKFCGECGSPKPVEQLTKCPDCGTEFGDNVPNFCPECGKKLK